MNNVGSTTLLHPVFNNLEQVKILRRVSTLIPLSWRACAANYTWLLWSLRPRGQKANGLGHHSTNMFERSLSISTLQALQAARINTNSYRCNKALRHILTYQNDEGSFGSILANIQVTPALLGESLLSLKKLDCPAGKNGELIPACLDIFQRISKLLNLSRDLEINEWKRGLNSTTTNTAIFLHFQLTTARG